MSSIRIFVASLAISFALAILAASNAAAQQEVRYRAMPVAETIFLPNPDTFGRIGMNNLGEVVYGMGDDAFLYLPNPNYDLPAGVHKLNDHSDRTGVCIARGISDYGFVVGTFGGTQTLEGEAIVWNLNQRDGDNKFVTTLLDTNDEFDWSGAFGVSNHATNPIIVGQGGFVGECYCGEEDTADPLQRVGFALRLSDAPIDTSEMLETTAENSAAWDATNRTKRSRDGSIAKLIIA